MEFLEAALFSAVAAGMIYVLAELPESASTFRRPGEMVNKLDRLLITFPKLMVLSFAGLSVILALVGVMKLIWTGLSSALKLVV